MRAPAFLSMFRFDRLTQKAQEGLQAAQAIAAQSQNQVIYPVHLLVALTQEREGIVRPVLEKCGVQPEAIVAEGQRIAAGLPKTSGQAPGMYLAPDTNAILESAFTEAERFKDEF